MNDATTLIDSAQLQQQAVELKLHGLQRHWQELTEEQYPWLAKLLSWELDERRQRSLERRLNQAKLGRFKPLTEFDWQWPTQIDQPSIHALMQLDFLTTASNLVLIGSNGVGKSTIAQNLSACCVFSASRLLIIPL